jgi:hypothetical protein
MLNPAQQIFNDICNNPETLRLQFDPTWRIGNQCYHPLTRPRKNPPVDFDPQWKIENQQYYHKDCVVPFTTLKLGNVYFCQDEQRRNILLVAKETGMVNVIAQVSVMAPTIVSEQYIFDKDVNQWVTRSKEIKTVDDIKEMLNLK